MSTDMFGCYQKFGSVRDDLIVVWVNVDVDVEAERFVFRKGRIVDVLSRVCFTFCVVYCVLNIISFVLCDWYCCQKRDLS